MKVCQLRAPTSSFGKHGHSFVTLQYMYIHVAMHMTVYISGGSRNLERGVQPRVHEEDPKILDCHAHFRYINTLVTHVIIVATDW